MGSGWRMSGLVAVRRWCCCTGGRATAHFWSHWSGPGFSVTEDHLDHLVTVYAQPGAFTASIGWYRAGAGALARSVAEQAPQPGGDLLEG